MNKRPIILVLCLILGLLFGSSCSLMGGKKRWQPVKPVRHAFVHTVAWPEETLPIIARWYTGKAEYADALAEANPTVDPERLALGTSVFIPRKLLKTRNMMPRDFVDKVLQEKSKPKRAKVRKPDKSRQTPKKNDEPEEEFELFGPR